ncbi:MAG: hypothetical protein JSW25_07600 [Thermoplasmata archaeon]|nr:MAG: hypothetical protein JSW25_07600 [Thermoplasmata archaeon]
MWQEVAVAAMVGLALSDAWLCLFMGASFATADRRMSWGFLAGRTIGVTALLMAIGLLGATLLPSKEWLVIIFAVCTLGVAVVLALSLYRPGLLGGGCSQEVNVSCDGGEPDGTGCDQGCDGCGASEEIHGVGTCGHMPQGLVRRLSDQSPWVAGLSLGAVRGAMPCLKVLIITPLLVVSPPTTVVLMALAFALTSSVYPLIGLVSGRTVANLSDNGRRLRLIGALGVAAVGVVLLVRFYQQACELGGL